MIICQTLRLVSLLKNAPRLPGEFGEFGGTVVASEVRPPIAHADDVVVGIDAQATVRASEWRSPGAVRDAGGVALGVDRGRDGLQIEVGAQELEIFSVEFV